ncbi:MAG: U32 family peptidase [Candidatus Schekmanbacteria bacterium]|nr:U32 family peptidase [Candidatus Schekmanbacteria bacterium]
MTKKAKKFMLHVPAGNLECLKAAADSGADVVYWGFNSPSNLRNFPGINFSCEEAFSGVDYLQRKGIKSLITINSYPQKDQLALCFEAIDQAHAIGADGVVLSDLALLEYCKNNHPQLEIYLSVQAGACNTEAINFYVNEFAVDWVILPRVVTVDEIARISKSTDVPLEAFAFGSLCINCEGKCQLSSYITGESTNTIGTCSTHKFLSFHQADKIYARINGKAINCFAPDEIKQDAHFAGGLPQEELHQWGNHFLINRRQLCKARYLLHDGKSYRLNNYVYLNTLELLPQLWQAGIRALKIEGRQRNAGYVGEVTKVFAAAVRAFRDHPDNYTVPDSWMDACRRQFPEIVPSTTCYLGK